MLRTPFILALALLVPACGSSDADSPDAPPPIGSPFDIGLVEGYAARLVVTQLNNPSCVAVSPGGRMAVCDAGHGRVLLIDDAGNPTILVDGFATEYWKPYVPRFRMGPISMTWIDDTRFAVADAGRPDGEERLLFFDRPGVAADGKPTNPIPPTTADPSDRGEGNLTGLSRSPDGKTLYVCGHGSDARTWLLACDVEARQLRTFASADVNGIETNSPMATLPWGKDALLAVYSGVGGVDDSLIVAWNVATRTPIAHWSLPGIADAYAVARVPGSTNELVIVDHVFDLAAVKPGRLARVTLAGSPADDAPHEPITAKVTIIANNLRGPTGCAFGADGRLFITQLGDEPDRNLGQLIAIDGFDRPAAAAPAR